MLPLPILALMAGGESEESCPEEAPAAPTYLIVSELDSALYLDWTQIDCEDGYDVYWDNGREDGNPDTLLVQTGVGVNFYNHTGLTNGTSYTYKVRATNAYGNGDFYPSSGGVGGTPTADPSAPNAPSGVGAAMQAVNTTIRVTWTDNSSDETHFNIYRSVNGSGYSLHTTAPANATSFDDTGLTLGNDYAYLVSAENGVGESAQAGPASVSNLGVCVAPTGVSPSAETQTSLTISWSHDQTPPEGVPDNFKLYRDSVHIATVNGSTFSYNDSGLSSGTAYTYGVSAINGAGETSQGTTGAATVMPPPSSFAASPQGGEPPTFYRFTWVDNSSTETGFSLYRDGSPWISVGPNVTQADVTAGDAEGHTWTVRANSPPGVAQSADSNSVSP